jgi:hypothetical protein
LRERTESDGNGSLWEPEILERHFLASISHYLLNRI